MAGQTLVPLSLPPGYVGREGQLAHSFINPHTIFSSTNGSNITLVLRLLKLMEIFKKRDILPQFTTF